MLLGGCWASGIAFAYAFGVWRVLVDEPGECGPEGEVVDRAEGVDPEQAGPVDGEQAWGASEGVAAHRDWRVDVELGSVDTDGEIDGVLVQKRGERHRGHGVVVLEDGMEPEHGEVATERGVDALGLGESVSDTSWAEHLERFNDHDLTSQAGDKNASRGWYQKAEALQARLVERRPWDAERKDEMDSIQKHIAELALPK